MNLLESEIKEPENIPVSENIEVSKTFQFPEIFFFYGHCRYVQRFRLNIFRHGRHYKSQGLLYRRQETFRGLIDKYPDLLGADKNLAISLDELAELFSDIGDFESAEMCYKDELHIYENLLQKNLKTLKS